MGASSRDANECMPRHSTPVCQLKHVLFIHIYDQVVSYMMSILVVQCVVYQQCISGNDFLTGLNA